VARVTAPTVSIGVPTYNRAATLERAVASALMQTHRQLEVVVSDNASTDGTEELCRRWAEREPRLRYLRRSQNVGPTANFNGVLAACGGDFVLLLADDDWLDPDYVERCLAELLARPDHALVCGRAVYVRDGREAGAGVATDLLEDDPAARVRRYLREVDDNGAFYGLARGDVVRRIGPMANRLGSDWFHVAAIAWCGKVRTIETTHLRRSVGGTSASIDDILRTLRHGGAVQSRVPYLTVAAGAFADVAWRSPAYAGLPRVRRLWLAATAAPCAIRWKFLAWHVVAPTLLRLRRRPRGRWLWRPFAWVVRRGGGFAEGEPEL
jgi:glycosyltransferase involved in cell wall biosynthesis